jgi:tetratricopeptide (TPR) repeat protein
MTPAPVEALAAPRLAAPTGSGVVIEPPVAAAPDVAAAWRTWPRWWFAAAGGGALAVVVVITLVARGGGHAAAPVAVAPRVDAGVATVAAAPVESDDPIPAVIDRAEDLAREGQLKPAIEALLKARRGAPGDARLPLTAGKLYLAKLWFGDAVPQLRAAFSIDQSLRGDPEVIKLLIAAFNAPRSYDAAIARFLRDDIGQAARPFLEEVAAHHPNAIVKKRAADELRRY